MERDNPGKYPLDKPLTSSAFLGWIQDAVIEIEHVQLLLAQPLSDDPAIHDQQVRECEAWFERVNFLYADALTFYDLAKSEALVKRCDDYTDMDRDAIQKARISHQKRVRDALEGLVESLKSRIMSGLSLRKAHVAERTTDRPPEDGEN